MKIENIVRKLQENDSMGRGSTTKAKAIRAEAKKRVPSDLDLQRQEKTQVWLHLFIWLLTSENL